MYCLPGHCCLCPSGSIQSETRWCPSVPPASWGSVLPTESQVASSGWHCWGQPCCWGRRGAPVSSVCGAESDCQKENTPSRSSHEIFFLHELQTKLQMKHLLSLLSVSELLSFFLSNIRTRSDLKGQESHMTCALFLHFHQFQEKELLLLCTISNFQL